MCLYLLFSGKVYILKANRFLVVHKTTMENAKAGLREWAKGINATLIEAVLVDCDMLTQLCRKYNALPINSVYI